MEKEEKKYSAGVIQYLQIKEQHKDYLLFYRVGDFYELFFDDAILVSRELGLALTYKDKAHDVPMCGVPYHAYETHMARLIRNGHKVAICEQMETPEEAKQRGGSGTLVHREVIRLATSGTLTEEILLDQRRNNYLLCAAKSGNSLGVSWLDLSTGEFYTQDISAEPKMLAAEFCSVLTRLQPEEIVLPDSALQNKDLFQMLHEMRDKLTPLPVARFHPKNAEKRIQEFFEVKEIDSFGHFSKAEVMAMGVLLDYLEMTQKKKVSFLHRPIKVMTEDFMSIDYTTRASLDLVTAKTKSLLSVIDETLTGAGARMLATHISAPLVNVQKINERLDVVEFFAKHGDGRENLRKKLKECADVERCLSRLSLNGGEPKDLATILFFLAMLPSIRTIVSTYKKTSVIDELPASLVAILNDLGNYYTLINELDAALDISDSMPKHNEGGFIKNGYSPELDTARSLRDQSHSYVSVLQEKYARLLNIDSLKIKYNNVIGYFIEVQSKYATQVMKNPDFIHRQSVLSATRFITVELTELENKIRTASEKALALELEIYRRLVRDVLIEAEDITKSSQAVAALDVGAALAHLAVENNYCRPVLDESLSFEVVNGRHPIVEHAMKHSDGENFVGNTCVLNVENDRLWLITGPNMAGKSTFLRQNAIIAIMAQMGSFVPAASAHIGVINKIFSRVGASDDLSRGRSTFMVEMIETASILNQADERSFVILDEIGRGTATFDGLSIAWSVVEYLHNVNKCRALFATHYHELVTLKDELTALSLHCMKTKEFNDQVVFMHEIIDGSADRSYGIHVAEMAGLPKSVVKRASHILKELENGSRSNAAKIQLSVDALPLFSHVQESSRKSPVEEALDNIHPDDMTARDALQKLYELKELVQKE
ncbi:MAG: DNA mismatch repair protein MutS [Alphaproteobacteria bacterium]|nr:DNA mismatch repair protein MutS [Alphaproteobacteria bacterium]